MLSKIDKHHVDCDIKQLTPETWESTGVKTIDNILYPVMNHAHGDELYVSQTDTAPSLVWSSATPNVSLVCDTDPEGYCVVFCAIGTGDLDDVIPLKLFEPDGTDTGVVFEWGTAYGDEKKSGVSRTPGDVRFSPDWQHIYWAQNEYTGMVASVRLHKYNRDGSREWRKDYTVSGLATSVIGMIIDSDENIYLSQGYSGDATGSYPMKIDSDGNTIRNYSSIKARACGVNSSINETLRKVYFVGTEEAVGLNNVVCYGIDMDSDSAITYSAVNNGSTSLGRQIVSIGNYVYILGITDLFGSNNIKKLDGSTLAFVAETNVSGAGRIWRDIDGNLAVGIAGSPNSSVVILDPDDFSEITAETTFGADIFNSDGLGTSRMALYFDWPGNNQLVIKSTGHNLSTGASITIASVAGTTELNGNTYTITRINDDYFSLDSTNWDNFSDYVSGGTYTASLQSRTIAYPQDWSHLEGETVQVVKDGIYLGDEEVSGGQITLDD